MAVTSLVTLSDKEQINVTAQSCHILCCEYNLHKTDFQFINGIYQELFEVFVNFQDFLHFSKVFIDHPAIDSRLVANSFH